MGTDFPFSGEIGQKTGFTILGNHMHVLLRLDLAWANVWWAEEVDLRYVELCPPKDRYRKRIEVWYAWIAGRAAGEEGRMETDGMSSRVLFSGESVSG